MSSEPAIRVEGLGKRYEIYETPRDRLKQFFLPPLRRALGLAERTWHREFWALRDVSFEVPKGEAFGVIGRNGSGKSTLLQLITGTLAPTTGTVTTHGRIAALLELGSGFNPDFSGRENVFLNGMVLGLSRREIEDRFDAIAAFADIGAHLEQPVRTYSSGMLVRLAFAVQVQVQPDILIVDEALAVGDALFQKRCFERIEKLISDGVTLIFVSHEQESVRTLTRRSLLLKNGAPVLCGNSSDVILAYRKQLHEEETSYFRDIASRVKAPAATTATDGAAPGAAGSMADKRSFGDGGARIENVQLSGGDGGSTSVFYPGDRLRIRITCAVDVDIENLNVGVRIRSREGIKIYSWGTLNQDMLALRGGADAPVFWRRRFKSGDRFDVELECECTLGPNLYEVQASISHEARPDYEAQRMLHWVDEAAFFTVVMQRKEYFFGGCVDLRMQARWQESR